MALLEEMSELIDRIHTAGLEPAHWASVASEVAAHFRANAAGLFVYHPGAPHWNFHANVGIEPDWLARFQGDFTIRDNPCELAMRDKPLGTVAADWMLMPLAERDKSRLVNEWAAPQGLRSAAIVKVAMGRAGVGLLSLIRSPKTGEWEQHDIDRLVMFSRHVVRALEVSTRLGLLQSRADFAEAVLNRSRAILVANRDGKVTYANAAACRLLEVRDGLCLARGLLAAACLDESAKLLRFIGTAVSMVEPRGGSMYLTRPSGRSPLSIVVVPGGPQVASPFSLEGTAILFVNDEDARRSHPDDALRRRYGLTRTEVAWVAFLVREPVTVREAAEHFDVSLNTAKTHLKRIYAKMNVRRQSELLKLILKGPLAAP